MAKSKRVNVKSILADPDLRRKLMVSTIQATQAREGIETSEADADKAYYVVAEGEKSAFFALKAFRPQAGDGDRRETCFVRELQDKEGSIRFDIRRNDFVAIRGSPLAYRWLHVLSPLFRENAALDPTFADARQGLISTESSRFVRQRWEVVSAVRRRWVPYAKGGDFCRFYSDLDLVFDWTDNGAEIKAIAAERYGSASRTIKCEDYYFRPGITWVEKTVKGMNARILPPGAIFNVAGPSAFPADDSDTHFLLGMLNSNVVQACLLCFSSRSWGAEYVGKVPIPRLEADRKRKISECSQAIYAAKRNWDTGNEISSQFRAPWLLNTDFIPEKHSIGETLKRLRLHENSETERIQRVYSELNDHVCRSYGISEPQREEIAALLGERPPEILWPQMGGKSEDQKRMEHIWRLLSFLVKRVVEADTDGIVPFSSLSGEPSLLERIRDELARQFVGQDVNSLEVEIVNELKRKIKSYKTSSSISHWLNNVYFGNHSSLYKNRPVFWHVASRQGRVEPAFSALVHYHRFDKDRFAKLRGDYLKSAIDTFRREAALAADDEREDDRVEWQGKVEEAEDLDRRLQRIQEGHHEGEEGGNRDFRILTPWKSPEERPKGWDPDIDDGVKVNIEPLQKAGVLRIPKVV